MGGRYVTGKFFEFGLNRKITFIFFFLRERKKFVDNDTNCL